ncbi:MAG: preprotein translocase subunit SecG [Candidatus Cyclobacteriaceae bacterium M3_2C_046]
MFILIISLTILVSLFLILVVLAQNSKGGGLSSQFGGSGSSQLMGVKKTSDILEKITWGLAVALVVFSLSSSILVSTQAPSGGFSSPNIEKAQDRNILPNLENNIGDVNSDLDTTGDIPLEQDSATIID